MCPQGAAGGEGGQEEGGRGGRGAGQGGGGRGHLLRSGAGLQAYKPVSPWVFREEQ